MAEDNTQPQVEDTQIEENAGTQPANTEKVEVKKEEKTYSQREFDDNAASTRRATEKETKKKILAQLGLTLDDEDKLNAFKEAYENSLTEEQKRDQEFQQLQDDNIELLQDLEEANYKIKALTQLTGKKEEDVQDIVDMARGLKKDDNTIEDAIKKVISMLKVTEEKPAVQQVVDNPDMPTSNEIQQPSTVSVDIQSNPFKAGPDFNLTKQGQILRSNPELAKRLANEAGVKLPNY